MKWMLILALFFSPIAQASKKEKPNMKTAQELLPGKWAMHIYLRDKEGQPRLFEDEVTIDRDDKGVLSGTLVVPKAFTAKLEKISHHGRHFAFEIEANEGHGAFRVRYEGDFHSEDNKTFVGFGNVLKPEKELLGGFVGQRLMDR